MSLKRVLRVLMELGLSEVDAQIYVFLSLHGPCKARQITDLMKLSKQHTYRSFKKLRKNNVVELSSGKPMVFSAVPFEMVLDVLSIEKEAQAQALEKVREDLIGSCQKKNNE